MFPLSSLRRERGDEQRVCVTPSLTLPLKGGGEKENCGGEEGEALWQRYCDARVEWCEDRGVAAERRMIAAFAEFARLYLGEAAAAEEIARLRCSLVRGRVGV
jgi:hypothetical protein